MILVRSRRQPSSGNKWFLLLLIGIILSDCSPKIVPTAKPVPPPVVVQKPVPIVEPPKGVVAATVPVISMLLPFGLDKLDLSQAATTPGLNEAVLAADYYQGFKFALDSLTAKGYSFKVQVYDTKGDAAQGHSLALNQKVRNSDLIVGPVFPEILKPFTATLGASAKPVLSPLSPASPTEFKSANLITAMPPLSYHAIYVAKYIVQKMRPVRIFLLKSGYSEENKFILPFLHAVDTIGKKSVTVVPVTVVHGNLDMLIPQLSKSSENIFVVPATDEPFLSVTLRSLDKIAQSYPVTVFGHPNWIKVDFLQAELLQRLKTHVTTSDRINYKSPAIMAFIRNYKRVYHIEPGEYAMKGFDEGYYFGTLLGANPSAFKQLDQNKYKGLLNDLEFKHSETYGWINTHVRMLQYQNFDLKPVE